MSVLSDEEIRELIGDANQSQRAFLFNHANKSFLDSMYIAAERRRKEKLAKSINERRQRLMAWDKDRPIAPFCVYGEKTLAYADGKREYMMQFTYEKPSEENIDEAWKSGSVVVVPYEDGWEGIEFRPFKEVELNLTYAGCKGKRNTFWWRDGNGVDYPMFVEEIDRLLEMGLLSRTMGGVWSAEKRGQNYGIRLEQLHFRDSSANTTSE